MEESTSRPVEESKEVVDNSPVEEDQQWDVAVEEEAVVQEAAIDFIIEGIFLARQAAAEASQEAPVVASATAKSSKTYGKKAPIDISANADVNIDIDTALETAPAVSVDNVSRIYTSDDDMDLEEEDILETIKYITSPVKHASTLQVSPAHMATTYDGERSATKDQIDNILFSPEAVSSSAPSAVESPQLLDSIFKSSGGSKASRGSDINEDLFGEVANNLSQSIFESVDSDEEVDFGTAQQILSQYEDDDNEVDVARVFDRAASASAHSSATASPAKPKGRISYLDESDNDDHYSRGDQSEDADNDATASPQRESKASSKKERQTVVEKEIETIRALEAGPTEDDLRRMKLIEVDEEEVEGHILKEQSLALRELTSVLDKIDARQQNKQFHETRRWLVTALRADAWLRDAVEPEFTVNKERRKIGKFAEVRVTPLCFMRPSLTPLFSLPDCKEVPAP